MKSTPRFLGTDRSGPRVGAVFAPFAALLALLPEDRFPTVEEIDAALSSSALTRFERASPRPRRGPRPTASYDKRIVEGFVPTRESNLHDLMNAIVWAAFPRAKREIHATQLRMLEVSADPSVRSGAHDTIAMLDEGGVLFSGDAEDPSGVVVFGHAILQHVVEKPGVVFGLGVSMDCDRPLDALDRDLEGMLKTPGRFHSHRSFPRVRVGG